MCACFDGRSVKIEFSYTYHVWSCISGNDITFAKESLSWHLVHEMFTLDLWTEQNSLAMYTTVERRSTLMARQATKIQDNWFSFFNTTVVLPWLPRTKFGLAIMGSFGSPSHRTSDTFQPYLLFGFFQLDFVIERILLSYSQHTWPLRVLHVLNVHSKAKQKELWRNQCPKCARRIFESRRPMNCR